MHHFFKPHQVSRIAVLFFLLILVTFGTVPSYLTGKWDWMKPLPIPTLKQLKTVRYQGLKIPGWETNLHKNIFIGGKKWLFQELINNNITAIMFLLTQNGPKDQPQVEWTDLKGLHRWKTDSYRTLNFTVKSPQITPENSQEISINAQFFRGMVENQNFAVLQWYALPTGGADAPIVWFLADRKAQLFNSRVPWVAVCIIIPMKSKDDLQKIQPLITSLGQKIQVELMKEALRF
jgi:cyanoexosortase B-associated protein